MRGAGDVEDEIVGGIRLLERVERDAGGIDAHPADAHHVAARTDAEVLPLPRRGLVDLDRLLDELVDETVLLPQEAVERASVREVLLVERGHQAERHDGALEHLRGRAQTPQARDLPDRGPLVDAQGGGMLRARDADDEPDQLGRQLEVVIDRREGLQQTARHRRRAQDPLRGDERADALVPHDLPVPVELVQRPAHRDDAHAGELGELGGAGQAVSLVQPLLLDQVDDEVVHVLVAQHPLGSGTLRTGAARDGGGAWSCHADPLVRRHRRGYVVIPGMRTHSSGGIPSACQVANTVSARPTASIDSGRAPIGSPSA